jgi:DNA-binding IclR family transcriptional regulator
VTTELASGSTPRGLSTARAVLKVLSFMSQNPEGVTARDVARTLGKSVSTAYDLIASLSEEGFAVHEPGRGYRLSPWVAFREQAPQPSHGRALARAVHDLFARTHRRSYLARVEAGGIVITASCGRQGIPRVPGLAHHIGANAHALAMGKVVLSLLPEGGRWRYIERGLQPFTARTITSPESLIAELEQARSSGYAIDRGEFHPDYCSVAAPVLGAHGGFMAVLGLSTFSRTFDSEGDDLVAAVCEVAAASGRHARIRAADDLRVARVHAPQAA